MNRGIDHLVLCVNDLDQARETYAALGFTTTPRAIHPFGTGNSLVQLQGNFLELLTVVDSSKFALPAAGTFSFGAFNDTFLSRREGMSMLVFEGHGADSDQAEFAKKGLETYDVFHFERPAKQPNGETVTVAFSLAFATDPSMPEAAFFTCQQHAPEYFWKPEYQKHENGAIAVTEVVMVADELSSVGDFLGALQAPNAVTSEADALYVKTARGTVTVLTPRRFSDQFGEEAPGPSSPHFAAFQIAVADIDQAEKLLSDNSVSFRRAAGKLQIGAASAFGAVLEFVQV